MHTLKLIFTAIGLVIFTIVVVQNTDVVEVQFLTWQISMSRIILLVLALLIGFGTGYTASHRHQRKKKKAQAAKAHVAQAAA